MSTPARPNHALATATAELPFSVTRRYQPDAQADCPQERAKVLRLELSKVVKRAREAADLTQVEVASAAGVSRGLVRLWEDPAEKDAPSLRHLAIAPRDMVLPLLAWAARQHDHELVALPSTLATPEHIEAEVRRACINALRALESGGDSFKRDAYRRLLECARMGLAVRA